MYVYIHIYIYIYIYLYENDMCVYIYIYVHIYIHTHVSSSVYLFICGTCYLFMGLRRFYKHLGRVSYEFRVLGVTRVFGV